MKRYLLILGIIMSGFSLQAQTAQWAEVTKLEEQSLPKSALDVVNQIYQNALKTGNSPELIKCIIYQLKYETAINRDQLPDRIVEIEQFAAADKNTVEQAVLYSLLAELYSNYYQANSYTINQRTALSSPLSYGEGPGERLDIREWTGNLFIQKIADLVDGSLRPAQALQKTNSLDYKEILTEGKSSRNLRPTLYDLLVQRGINNLNNLTANRNTQNYFPQTRFTNNNYYTPVKEFIHLNIPANTYDFAPQILKLYQQLLTFRLSQGQQTRNDKLALLMADLDRLIFVKINTVESENEKPYLEALNQLKEQYKTDDFCVEILSMEADFYYQNQYSEKSDDYVQKAYDICMDGIKKYPKYERIGLLQNLLSQITESNVSITADNVVYPGKELKLKLNYKNYNHLTVEIYKINAPVSVYSNNWSREGQYKKAGTLVEKHEFNLINEQPYLNSDTIFRIPVKDLGVYEYVISADQVKQSVANQQFSVSRLATISRSIGNQREFLVVDRISGKPIEGAKINFYTRKTNSLELVKDKALITNSSGLALGGNEKDIYFYNASMGDDTALITSAVPWISTSGTSNANTFRLNLFTDRSIYRPGQTVYFKGIAFETGKDTQHVTPHKTYTLTFRDANSKEVSNQKLTTNELGSFNGEFVIPQGSLTGNYTIESDANGGYASIKVEEYKRPTFDILFDKNEKTERFGDEVTVKGTAQTFSGIHLQEANVQYRITRQNHWLYRGRFYSPVQVAEGTVQTKDDGRFEIAFTPEKAFEDQNSQAVYYTYTIEATITDTNGETQSAQTRFFMGDKSMYLSVSGLSDVVDKENLPAVTINALNLSGVSVPAKGSYQIYSLKTSNKTPLNLEKKEWEQDKRILSGSFESGKAIDCSQLKAIASGRYRLIAKATDEKGREIETQQDFTLASKQDKRPPVPVYEWLMTPQTTCAVGEKAEIIYGSSAKDVYVLYELFKGNKKIASSRFVLNNENKKIEIPFLESYGEGITAMFSFVKEEKFFTKTVRIYKKQEDKTLDLQMEVFRDHLLPGQKEEWKLSVKEANKQPVLAELLAGMYDASLDKIYAHSWNFNPVQPVYLWNPSNQEGNEFNSSGKSLSHEGKYIEVPSFTYDSFNWFGFNVYNQSLKTVLRSKALGVSSENGVYDTMESATAGPPPAFAGTVQFTPPIIVADEDVVSVGEISQQDVQLRQNFNETAFFYPQLKTNEAGETLISFTIPESNTTWKFMGLAHTKDLKYGQIIKEVISQKKLMITPTIPRFIREGDRMTISSNISNLSETPVTGTVSIECFDPNTGESNIVIANASKEFSIEAGKTTSVNWTFEVPSKIDLTALKIVAQSSDFSDGEQHLIPVLPNRMLVTESLPLNVLGGQTRTFSFDKPAQNTSPTLENYRMTLEFTSNPTWYAVQALPSITTPQTDNVLSWFAAYYSNSLAVRIANSTSKIKQIIDVWTKQGGINRDAIYDVSTISNLEKNPELKAVLLEETPWVLEAENETEQKQRLALLFDINRSNNLNAQALDKLKSLQTEDGGWSWFKGMSGSVPITQWILYGLAENDLKNLKNLKDLKLKALQFIDQKFKQQYEYFKKYNPDWKKKQAISTSELEYLFVRSLYKDIPLGETGEAVQFYTHIAAQYWAKNPNLYDRALAAMLMQRNGSTPVANAIIKSLREHASHHPDLGMYWANNNTNSFMTQSATCVHTFIMEAFQEVGTTAKEMDEMKLWLLKQKQTQLWESVPATVNAINILLKTGSNWLESRGKVAVQIDDKAIDIAGEAGTGYFKTDLKELKSLKKLKPLKITLSKEDAGPAWGALYWQYFEDLDKITPAKTGLHVEKALFIEKISAAGKTLAPVTESSPLKVGDKVTVRLTVRTDRDMEYVLLKDLRASCFEPVDQLSGTQWKQGLVYYQSPRDASMNFFFSAVPKGTYVFEYNLYVTSAGDYSNGITTIQCMYAPEFVSHTSGGRVVVK
ncbi:MAG: alpha-2-macroglobulin [Candidatus Symbiothrix sp.]|jgi:uncharacterized protein YfaS (alpha-2-macroglobulin family)|nr:alpha-2-macroglobulin [Candidatus Symbiothrix sp.]